MNMVAGAGNHQVGRSGLADTRDAVEAETKWAAVEAETKWAAVEAETKWAADLAKHVKSPDLSPSSTLEEIGQRIRRATIRAGILHANIEALSNRAFGPQPEPSIGKGETDEPYGTVAQTMHSLDELDTMLARLEAATDRVLVLA